MSKIPIAASALPEQARLSILRNVTAQSTPWLLLNFATDPPSLIPSGTLTRKQWLAALDAIRHSAASLDEFAPAEPKKGGPPRKRSA